MNRRQSLLLIVGLFLVTGNLFGAGIPQLMNYQGMLLNGDGSPVSGTRSVEFLIYNVETEGTALWSETQDVTVADGQFSALLGSVTPIPAVIFTTPEAYLTLRIGTDTEMTPRQRLVSAGFAFQANNADSLSGHSIDAFVQKGEENSVDAGMITPDIISSIDGVSNDGGNVDLIAGSNVTITPDDEANTITISASGGSAGDNLGNHTATQNIKLNGHWLSNDGGDEGIKISNNGNVGINDEPSSTYRFHVYGTSQGSQLKADNYIVTGSPTASPGSGDIVADEDLVADGDVIAGDDIIAGDQVISGGLMSCGGNMVVENHLGVNMGGGYSTLYPLRVYGSTEITDDLALGDRLYCNGHAGINGGVSTTYALRVNGSGYATGSWTSSDIKFKKNVEGLTLATTKLMNLRGVSYEWKTEEYPENGFEEGQQFGLIAQEVEAVFPELVKTDENGEKAVNYIGLIPIMLETIKDQQRRIESLEAKLNQ